MQIKMNSLEASAFTALTAFQMGDRESGVDYLLQVFNEANSNPELLAEVTDHGIIGNAFLMMLIEQISSAADFLQQISSISYLFLTKAIERNPGNLSLVGNRVVLLENARQYLVWTVIPALNLMPSAQGVLASMGPTAARQMIVKMQLADIEAHPHLMEDMQFAELRNKILILIRDGVFGTDENKATIIKSGYEAHKRMLGYLHEKIVEEADIDF